MRGSVWLRAGEEKNMWMVWKMMIKCFLLLLWASWSGTIAKVWDDKKKKSAVLKGKYETSVTVVFSAL